MRSITIHKKSVVLLLVKVIQDKNYSRLKQGRSSPVIVYVVKEKRKCNCGEFVGYHKEGAFERILISLCVIIRELFCLVQENEFFRCINNATESPIFRDTKNGQPYIFVSSM